MVCFTELWTTTLRGRISGDGRKEVRLGSGRGGDRRKLGLWSRLKVIDEW